MQKENKIASATAIIVKRGNKLLLTKRTKESASGYNTYAFAGGKVEEGETLVDSAIRELGEELGLERNQSEMKFIGNVGPSDDSPFNTYFYLTNLKITDNIENLEPEKHESWEWYDYRELPKPLFEVISEELIRNAVIEDNDFFNYDLSKINNLLNINNYVELYLTGAFFEKDITKTTEEAVKAFQPLLIEYTTFLLCSPIYMVMDGQGGIFFIDKYKNNILIVIVNKDGETVLHDIILSKEKYKIEDIKTVKDINVVSFQLGLRDKIRRGYKKEHLEKFYSEAYQKGEVVDV